MKESVKKDTDTSNVVRMSYTVRNIHKILQNISKDIETNIEHLKNAPKIPSSLPVEKVDQIKSIIGQYIDSSLEELELLKKNLETGKPAIQKLMFVLNSFKSNQNLFENK